MIKMRDLLNEISAGNILYHIITEPNFEAVLREDKLAARPFDKFQLSFSRDKNYSYVSGTFEKRYVRFHVDRNKLASKFKIKTFNDSRYKYRSETEEIVIGPIKNFGRYLIAIEFIRKEESVNPELADELRKYLKIYSNIKLINPPNEFSEIQNKTSTGIEGIYQSNKGLISKFDRSWKETFKNVLDTNQEPVFKTTRLEKDEPFSDYSAILGGAVSFEEIMPNKFAVIRFDTTSKKYEVSYKNDFMKSYIQKLFPTEQFQYNFINEHSDIND